MNLNYNMFYSCNKFITWIKTGFTCKLKLKTSSYMNLPLIFVCFVDLRCFWFHEDLSSGPDQSIQTGHACSWRVLHPGQRAGQECVRLERCVFTMTDYRFPYPNHPPSLCLPPSPLSLFLFLAILYNWTNWKQTSGNTCLRRLNCIVKASAIIHVKTC